MLRLKYLIPLLIFLFVCVFLFVGLYLDPRKVPSALIDKPAPEFSLPTMSGETVTKKDLLGKVYLLNVLGFLVRSLPLRASVLHSAQE